ncbi:hypothetical protein V497_08881 [Pseudogymnoascus sp. VKM F-4516 (FW-969)]|nr:hypothetical protein V497_08881 [Pseudogymnoascus sp. VKM F-4516 (FW-969)]
MGSYKAYLEQGLDLCPKIYVQEEPEPPLQHADDPEPPDDVSQGKQLDYECTASSSNPTRRSHDTGIARDHIVSSSVPTRSSQDTRFALTTSSSKRTHASQEIQVTRGVVSASSSNSTIRSSQDRHPAGSTPPNLSIYANQSDFRAPPRNPTPSTPRSNPLPSQPTHPLETGLLRSQSLKSEDRTQSPPPPAQQKCDPYPPCAKRLWSKVLCSPPPAEAKPPRSSGLWSKVLCSPATPPQERESPEPQAPRPHGLFTRRRRSSVPLPELPSAELQPREIDKERRQSTPMLVARSHTP